MSTLWSQNLSPFILMIVVLFSCSQPTQEENERSQGYEQDADILREALTVLYPSLDRYDQKETVIAALDHLDAVASTTDDPLAFYRAVANVAASTKDEHVIPFPSQAYRDLRRQEQIMLPYTVIWVDQQPYVAAVADMAFKDLIGQRVLAFDGHQADEVLETLSATIPSDGLSETFSIRRLQDFTPTQNENYFDLNYPIWFGASDSYRLEVQASDGRVTELQLDALEWDAFREFYRRRLPREEPMSFRWLSEDVGYLSVLSFHDWYYDEHDIVAEDRLATIFGGLNARPDARLILDLRRNEGGGDISSMLLDYLLTEPFTEYDEIYTNYVGRPDVAEFCENTEDMRIDPNWAEAHSKGLFVLRDNFRHLIMGANERAPNDDAFSGELVVLISGATGSAAVKVASVLDREDRATFVGEETGGAAAGATAFGYCSLRLPASGIRVDIPLIRFERDQGIPYGRGVLPDVTIDAGRRPPITPTDEVLDSAIALN